MTRKIVMAALSTNDAVVIARTVNTSQICITHARNSKFSV